MLKELDIKKQPTQYAQNVRLAIISLAARYEAVKKIHEITVSAQQLIAMKSEKKLLEAQINTLVEHYNCLDT